MKTKSLKILKTMLKESYDTSGIIDEYTGKLNKKSIRNWIIIIVAVIATYLSYNFIGLFKQIGVEKFFLDIYFMIFNILVLFEATILTINSVYFENDIKKYIYMPLSSKELMLTKFGVALSIIFGTELLIAVPSMFIYGARTVQSTLFYPISMIVLILTTLFLTSIIVIVISILVKLFKFIKKKNIYQSFILIITTLLIILPIGITIKDIQAEINNENSIINREIDEEVEKSELENVFNQLANKIFKINKILIIPDIGIKAISEINLKSFIYILEMISVDIILFSIIMVIGKKTYLKSVLYIISMFNSKKIKNINLRKKLKHRKKEVTYLKNEFKVLLKNQIFFMQYIYNAFVILMILSAITIPLSRVIKQIIEVDSTINLTFDFEIFSIIIGIIQIIFTFSSASLTSFSRYGRNAVFFKYIPIDLRKQFILKIIPGITINTTIIAIVTGVVRFIVQSVGNIYFLYMFIIAMLINLIYNYLLIFIDLWRPQTHLESEVSVVKQNENTKLKYVLSTLICLILWYIKEVTKNVSLDTSIIIELIIFAIIFIILNIIVLIKKEKIFKNIR